MLSSQRKYISTLTPTPIMAYSSWNYGRDARTYCGLCFGPMAIAFGLFLWFMFVITGELIIQFFSLILLVIGSMLVVVGVITWPATRRRSRLMRQVLEIAAVEKEVSISDIHTRTGIDSETVREILAACLINRVLFGYIEGDLFVRDTAGRPPAYSRHMGLDGH